MIICGENISILTTLLGGLTINQRPHGEKRIRAGDQIGFHVVRLKL